MPTPIVSNGDYEDVRRAIDISFDVKVLPDAVIASDIFLGAATSDILSRVDYAGMNADAQAHIKRAVIYLTAAYIAPAMPDIISEQLSANRSYTRKAMDFPTIAKQLEADANREVTLALTGGVERVKIPTMFSLAKGRRGQ